MIISQHNKEALKNPWVLGLILFLLTFLSANAVFIYLAFKSPPNLVVEDFYERGERYEETQKKIEKEKSLGWVGQIMTPATMRVNQHQTYEVLLQGKNSVRIALNSVVINAYRPSDARADFSETMAPSQPGIYKAELSFPLPGIWDVIVVAKDGEHEFLVTKRVNIRP
ncbi:FixH family protein [Pseudomonadota bacterium]|nr:FixH family protein [Pseudomonadota bacterium]